MNGLLSNQYSINAGVPQGSFSSHVLFIFFINNLLTSTSSSIHSFADNTSLSSSFSFNPSNHASTDIQLHRNISALLLSNDLTVIEKWDKDNLVLFNQSKTKQAVISRKRNQDFPAVFMNGDELDTSASFTQFGLSLSSNLTWTTHIHSLAKHASQKLGFLARACGFFSSFCILTIYKSQIPFGYLSIFYRYHHGHCSQEISDIFPVPLRHVRITRSSTHSHPFQVSLPNPQTLSHKPSFISGTCSLWNVLPSSCFPESYNLPSCKSKIDRLDLISLSS